MQSYLALFPGYTRSMPRFSALAQAVLRQAEDLQALVPQLESGFSFAAAKGIQLDALGESVSLPRQEGWSDETYRAVLLRKLKRCRWDGTNETVPDFLEEGETFTDNDNGTVSVHTQAPLPLPAGELLPVPMGVKVISGAVTERSDLPAGENQ